MTITGVAIDSPPSGSVDFNGTFTVASVPQAAEFTYDQTGVNEQGTGGVALPPGNVDAGTHQVAVSFITRQGYWTQPSPVAAWTAAGGAKAFVENIPTGPSNVVGRLVMFTPAVALGVADCGPLSSQ